MSNETQANQPRRQETWGASLGFDQTTWIILLVFVLLCFFLVYKGYPAYWRMTRHNAAAKAISEQKYGDAIKPLNELIKEDPQEKDWALRQLAESYLALKKPDQALDALKQIQSSNPNADLDELLGSAYAQKDDTARASEYFNKILKNNPQNAAANFYFGVQELKAGNLLNAGQAFQRVSSNPRYDKLAEPYREELARRVKSEDAQTTAPAKGK